MDNYDMALHKIMARVRNLQEEIEHLKRYLHHG